MGQYVPGDTGVVVDAAVDVDGKTESESGIANKQCCCDLTPSTINKLVFTFSAIQAKAASMHSWAMSAPTNPWVSRAT